MICNGHFSSVIFLKMVNSEPPTNFHHFKKQKLPHMLSFSLFQPLLLFVQVIHFKIESELG